MAVTETYSCFICGTVYKDYVPASCSRCGGNNWNVAKKSGSETCSNCHGSGKVNVPVYTSYDAYLPSGAEIRRQRQTGSRVGHCPDCNGSGVVRY